MLTYGNVRCWKYLASEQNNIEFKIHSISFCKVSAITGGNFKVSKVKILKSQGSLHQQTQLVTHITSQLFDRRKIYSTAFA